MAVRGSPLRIGPVTEENVGDLDALFSRGDPRWCQCVFFRQASGDWSSSTQPRIARIDDKPVWSIMCFVVPATARRQGDAGRLLAAAVHYARDRGARLLGAYPVDSSSGTTSSAALYRGMLSIFE